MTPHIETRLVWDEVANYHNVGDGTTIAHEPQVLLWHPRYGLALGQVLRWSDGEIITVSAAHGFTYTHFAYLETPAELAPAYIAQQFSKQG